MITFTLARVLGLGALGSAALLALAPGCVEIDPDRYTYACETNADCGAEHACVGGLCYVEWAIHSRTLEIDLVGMGPHVDQRFELRILGKERLLETLLVVDRLRTPELFVVLPNALPLGRLEHTLEFYSDLQANGIYDRPDSSGMWQDHAWRRLLNWDDTYLAFTHVGTFEDIGLEGFTTPGVDLDMFFGGFPTSEVSNLHAEVYLRGNQTQLERLYGLYQIRPYNVDGQNWLLPGVLDGNNEHRLDVWFDADGDNEYDPGSDPAWRRCFPAPSGGSHTIQVLYGDLQIPDKNATWECPNGG